MNAAMKYGVNKLLEEENLRNAQDPGLSRQDDNKGINRVTFDSGGGEVFSVTTLIHFQSLH